MAVPDCTGPKALEAGCYISRYEALTRSAGADAALDDLAERRANSGYVSAACHQLTHVVGRTAGESSGLAAFRQGSELCASGYYHGVVEAVMIALGPDQVDRQAEAVCSEFRQRGPHSYLHYNCVHGMGHGFMATYGTDVFRSLIGCDQLIENWEREHCYSGVFMENLTAIVNPSRPSKALNPREPLYPCTAVEDRFKHECYLKQTAYAIYVTHDDYGAVFRLCQESADIDFRDVCYQGVGGDAAIMSSKFVIGEAAQATSVRDLCQLGPVEEARLSCVIGAVETIIRDLSGDDTQARALCVVLDGTDLESVCQKTREEVGKKLTSAGHVHQH